MNYEILGNAVSYLEERVSTDLLSQIADLKRQGLSWQDAFKKMREKGLYSKITSVNTPGMQPVVSYTDIQAYYNAFTPTLKKAVSDTGPALDPELHNKRLGGQYAIDMALYEINENLSQLPSGDSRTSIFNDMKKAYNALQKVYAYELPDFDTSRSKLDSIANSIVPARKLLGKEAAINNILPDEAKDYNAYLNALADRIIKIVEHKAHIKKPFENILKDEILVKPAIHPAETKIVKEEVILENKVPPPTIDKPEESVVPENAVPEKKSNLLPLAAVGAIAFLILN